MVTRAALLSILTLVATSALAADSQLFPKGKDVVFRAGVCKAELVQASMDGGKTLLNKGECAAWGLIENQIAQVHTAGECAVYYEYTVEMDEFPILDCDKRPEKKQLL